MLVVSECDVQVLQQGRVEGLEASSFVSDSPSTLFRLLCRGEVVGRFPVAVDVLESFLGSFVESDLSRRLRFAKQTCKRTANMQVNMKATNMHASMQASQQQHASGNNRNHCTGAAGATGDERRSCRAIHSISDDAF